MQVQPLASLVDPLACALFTVWNTAFAFLAIVRIRDEVRNVRIRVAFHRPTCVIVRVAAFTLESPTQRHRITTEIVELGVIDFEFRADIVLTTVIPFVPAHDLAFLFELIAFVHLFRFPLAVNVIGPVFYRT